MEIIDSHIHIGQFYEAYTDPTSLIHFLKKNGIKRCAVSSTSIGSGDYDKVLHEMQEIVSIGGEMVVPVMWIAPDMLHGDWLEKYLNSGVRWKCLKIHGYLHHWNYDNIKIVVDLAKELSLPLLFHTGGRQQCDAGYYYDIIKQNPSQTFILAHSRPVSETIEIMQECPNAWADTAFVPVDDVKKMIDSGLVDRMMFGTDYPISTYYYKEDSNLVYKKQVEEMQSSMSAEDWEKIACLNFEKLF